MSRSLVALLVGAALGVLSFLQTGCAQIPGITQDPPPLPAPPSPEPASFAPAPGSLWRGAASQRFLAFENRARDVGDLLTVLISESAEAEKEAKTEIDRQSSIEAKIDSDVSLQNLIANPIRGVLSLLGLTEQGNDDDPSGELGVVKAETDTEFDAQGKLSREATFVTTIACLITDVTESGLLRVEGERQLRINNETQIIQLAGWVRPEDIKIDNTISSEFIANADIQYHGVGVVSEKQHSPWLTRVFDLMLPF